jgi:hypothetical protein
MKKEIKNKNELYLFIPDYVINSNEELKKISVSNNFLPLNKLNSIKKIPKIVDNGKKLDDEIFKELNLKKYGITKEDLQNNLDKYLSEISSSFDKNFFKKQNIKSLSIKTLATFVLEFTKNTYSEENISKYLINQNELKKNKIYYKNLFKIQYKLDLINNLYNFINKIIENNESKFNILITKIKNSGKRPRNIKKLISYLLLDSINYYERIKFFCKREIFDLKLKLEQLDIKETKIYSKYELLIKKSNEEINYLDKKINKLNNIRKKLPRNIFLRTFDKIPGLRKISLKIGYDKFYSEISAEFKDKKNKN